MAKRALEAEIKKLKKAIEKYKDFIDGVTTNPSILASSEGKSVEDLVLHIVQLVSGPVSVEVISENSKEMVKEGKGVCILRRGDL